MPTIGSSLAKAWINHANRYQELRNKEREFHVSRKELHKHTSETLNEAAKTPSLASEIFTAFNEEMRSANFETQFLMLTEEENATNKKAQELYEKITYRMKASPEIAASIAENERFANEVKNAVDQMIEKYDKSDVLSDQFKEYDDFLKEIRDLALEMHCRPDKDKKKQLPIKNYINVLKRAIQDPHITQFEKLALFFSYGVGTYKPEQEHMNTFRDDCSMMLGMSDNQFLLLLSQKKSLTKSELDFKIQGCAYSLSKNKGFDRLSAKKIATTYVEFADQFLKDLFFIFKN